MIEQSAQINTSQIPNTNARMREDLSKSGLIPEDMRVTEMDMSHKAACGISPKAEGYVIPYYNISGRPTPFYRVKLFDRDDIKYLQLKDSGNHIYFPHNYQQTLAESMKKGNRYVIITEGEKKAAAAIKSGHPAIAFSGVDSWRNKIILLPKGTDFGAYNYNKNLIRARLPDSSDLHLATNEPVSIGFDEFCIQLTSLELTPIIVYDSDEQNQYGILKSQVQRAAAELGFELRRRGVRMARIRQLVLPNYNPKGEVAYKTGLDDYLNYVPNGPTLFAELIQDTLHKRSCFPRHPSIEDDVSKKLQNSKLSRKDLQRLALQLITDLDAKGVRMHSKDEQQLYYFEEKTHQLIKVSTGSNSEAMETTEFSKLLYTKYGISTTSDNRLMKWVSTQFGAEEPIEHVNPYRLMARPQSQDDVIRYQINDGQYAKVTAEGLEILDNGSENVLFEAGQVEPIDADELIKEFQLRNDSTLEMWWEDVLHEVRLKNHGRQATIIALLFYLSPWLHRWRGTQLPAELVVGEAGSGKSTLYELRLSILSGQPRLRPAPSDIKDWHASIVNTGGLHVTDNVQLLDRTMKQRLSDELCRLITEPDPHIEMRKLYSNADLMRVKVDPVFAFTSIVQAFQNADLLQRSIIIELDKLAHDSSAKTDDPQHVTYDSLWKQKQLDRFGGRTAWIAHHLHVMSKFFQHVQKKWDPNYKAKHRLINLEQALVVLADMFKLESDWIPEYLSGSINDSLTEADWSLEGLKEFVLQVSQHNAKGDLTTWASGFTQDLSITKDFRFTCQGIANWASQQEAFMECQNLTNSRRLGRYLQTHKAMIASTAKILESRSHNNRMTYQINPIKAKDLPT